MPLCDSCLHNNKTWRGPVRTILKNKDKIDYIFLFVHGVSFSSKFFRSNLTDVYQTINKLDSMFFWEANCSYHLELIDWKDITSKFQYALGEFWTPSGVKKKTETEMLNCCSKCKSIASERLAKFPGSRLFSWLNFTNKEAKNNSKNTNENFVGDLMNSSDAHAPNVEICNELVARNGFSVYASLILADIIFYSHPRYGSYYAQTLARLLNQRVKALRDDPSGMYKDSEIILVGHSLGGVLLTEILSGRPLRPSAFDEADKVEKSLYRTVKIPTNDEIKPVELEFTTKHLFLLGSPIGFYVSLKNDYKFCSGSMFSGTKHAGTRFYNIFNANDPLATRLEPIIYTNMSFISEPVNVASVPNKSVIAKYFTILKSFSSERLFKTITFKNPSNSLLDEKSPQTQQIYRICNYQRRYRTPFIRNEHERYGAPSKVVADWFDDATNISKYKAITKKASNSDKPCYDLDLEQLSKCDFLKTGNPAYTLRQLVLYLVALLRMNTTLTAENLLFNSIKASVALIPREHLVETANTSCVENAKPTNIRTSKSEIVVTKRHYQASEMNKDYMNTLQSASEYASKMTTLKSQSSKTASMSSSMPGAFDEDDPSHVKFDVLHADTPVNDLHSVVAPSYEQDTAISSDSDKESAVVSDRISFLLEEDSGFEAYGSKPVTLNLNLDDALFKYFEKLFYCPHTCDDFASVNQSLFYNWTKKQSQTKEDKLTHEHELELFRLNNRINELIDCLKNSTEVHKKVYNFRRKYRKLIDAKIGSFISSVISKKVTYNFRAYGEMSIDTWFDKTAFIEMEETGALSKRELNSIFDKSVCQEEDYFGSLLPGRYDFKVTGSLSVSVIKSLSYLKSHISYWKCEDSIYFMLRQVLGFNPNVHITECAQYINNITKLQTAIVDQIRQIPIVI